MPSEQLFKPIAVRRAAIDDGDFGADACVKGMNVRLVGQATYAG